MLPPMRVSVAAGSGVLIHEPVSFVYADGGEAWLDEDAPVDDGGAMPDARAGWRLIAAQWAE
jgi:UDP-glucose 4-epimerase